MARQEQTPRSGSTRTIGPCHREPAGSSASGGRGDPVQPLEIAASSRLRQDSSR